MELENHPQSVEVNGHPLDVGHTVMPARESYEGISRDTNIEGSFVLTVLGDLLYTFPMLDIDDPKLREVLRTATRSDFIVGNLEGPLVAADDVDALPIGNAMLRIQPSVAEDLATIGISGVTLANNHLTDWGPAGVMSTIRYLDEAGIGHAGAGATLQEAREGALFSIQQGSIALVSASSTMKPSSMANDALEDFPARPGLNPLRLEPSVHITAAEMEVVRGIATRLASGRVQKPVHDAEIVKILDQTFQISHEPKVSWRLNEVDRVQILNSITVARRNSDLTIFAIHAHESSTGFDDDLPQPPEFLVSFLHDAVRSGAHLAIAGGPHSLRGIEIFEGCPIFYGMGVFTLEGEIFISQELRQELVCKEDIGSQLQPSSIPTARGGNPRNWYQGVIAEVMYREGKMHKVQLIPLDLRPDAEADRGRPCIAVGIEANRILSEIALASNQFGTKIQIDSGIGYITLSDD